MTPQHRMRRTADARWLVGVIVGITLVVAAFDFWTSAAAVGSILFTFPLALCALLDSKRLVWGTALAAVTLTIAAEFWGVNRTDTGDLEVALFNRVVLIASLLTLATFIHLWIDKNETIARDAAEIRRQEARLVAQTAEADQRYRNLLEAAPDAMVVVDQRGRIVLLNEEAERMFGYGRDELVGKAATLIVPSARVERLSVQGEWTREDVLAQLANPGVERAALRKDGTEFPVELKLSPLESPDGILVTGAIRDITLRKAAEGMLRSAVDELKRSNEELDQFAYVTAHDLQEPLRMVASYAQLLSKRYTGKLDTEADEFIAFLVDGADRMQRLIEDLLAFSRVSSGGAELHAASSEQALGHALQNLTGSIHDSGALVTHDPLPSVMADEMQLAQLFQNLVGNGIKYQGAGVPRVHVSATSTGLSDWTFAVTDNGLGIDAAHFEKIFGMFERLHGRGEFPGTGIGLAICKKIVERHGGRITVASEPGQGSTFSFNLRAGVALAA